MTQPKTVLWRAAGLLLALVLLSGCDKDSGYTLAYSHNQHVKDLGIACADCHGKMTNGQYAVISHATCKECHGDWIDTQTISTNTCGKCHKVKDLKALPPYTTTNAPGERVKSLFVHTSAVSNRCEACHGALLDKKLNYAPELTHKAKVAMRTQAHGWGMDCTACHANMDKKTPPPSHEDNWTRMHGKMGQQPDNTCNMCHPQDTCRACHQTTKPQSHNNLWRLKTHGSQAAWDRERCLVCHRQDSCAACHANTVPQSHNASWLHNHCYSCHAQPAQNACAACHPGGNSMLIHQPLWTGPLAFHNNNPSIDCTACHYPGPGGLARRRAVAPKSAPHNP